MSIYQFFDDLEGGIYEDVYSEVIEMFGLEFYYIPRKTIKMDNIIGEDPLQQFPVKYKITAFFDDYEGWNGLGDIFSKFGLVQDQELTLTITKAKFKEATGLIRPFVGDLIYIEWTNPGGSVTIYEITFIPEEVPFYHLGKVPAYTIKSRRWQYSHEEVNISTDEIENVIERDDFMSDNFDLDNEAESIITTD